MTFSKPGSNGTTWYAPRENTEVAGRQIRRERPRKQHVGMPCRQVEHRDLRMRERTAAPDGEEDMPAIRQEPRPKVGRVRFGAVGFRELDWLSAIRRDLPQT